MHPRHIQVHLNLVAIPRQVEVRVIPLHQGALHILHRAEVLAIQVPVAPAHTQVRVIAPRREAPRIVPQADQVVIVPLPQGVPVTPRHQEAHLIAQVQVGHHLIVVHQDRVVIQVHPLVVQVIVLRVGPVAIQVPPRSQVHTHRQVDPLHIAQVQVGHPRIQVAAAAPVTPALPHDQARIQVHQDPHRILAQVLDQVLIHRVVDRHLIVHLLRDPVAIPVLQGQVAIVHPHLGALVILRLVDLHHIVVHLDRASRRVVAIAPRRLEVVLIHPQVAEALVILVRVGHRAIRHPRDHHHIVRALAEAPPIVVHRVYQVVIHQVVIHQAAVPVVIVHHQVEVVLTHHPVVGQVVTQVHPQDLVLIHQAPTHRQVEVVVIVPHQDPQVTLHQVVEALVTVHPLVEQQLKLLEYSLLMQPHLPQYLLQ